MTYSSIGQITNNAIGRQRALRQAEAQLSLQQKWRIARATAIANLDGVDPRSTADRPRQERDQNYWFPRR
jgi:hypothetical protein